MKREGRRQGGKEQGGRGTARAEGVTVKGVRSQGKS